jgi:hypothetical protein
MLVKRQNAILAIGVTVCLLGAFLMVWGDPILGENHTGIATIVGILGIGIITSSKTSTLAVKREVGIKIS